MFAKATLIAESRLKTCKVFDAFKTFIIPMQNFWCRILTSLWQAGSFGCIFKEPYLQTYGRSEN
jgi:hypothetical protein